jgi:hypothetical protein
MTAPEGSTRSAGRRVGELLNHTLFTPQEEVIHETDKSFT